MQGSVVILVKIIMGLKGSGKTKKLVDLVRDAIEANTGDVVVIEKERKLTYDIPYQARLVDASAYGICSYELIKGFISGIHAGNYDITHFFIDNFLKIVDDKSEAPFKAFLSWLDAFSARESIDFVLSVTAEPENVSGDIAKYLI